MEVVKKTRKVSLVLGSGGARGLTQIGVIQYLVQQGYEIDEVVGCSIGSLIGGAFACGKLDELGAWMQGLTKTQVFRLMDFSNSGNGLLKGKRVLNTLQTVFCDVDIESLPIRYAAIASDLIAEEEKLFATGSLYAAIRASIAIPGVFTGVQLSNSFLVDGAVLNPLPVNQVVKKGNLIVAVNLDGRLDKPKLPPAKLNAIALMEESFYAMRRRLATLTLRLNPPDYLIDIPLDVAGIWDYHRAEDLIAKGHALAEKTFTQHDLFSSKEGV